MQGARPRFDGECDVAAMVYRPTDDPDAVLEEFIRRLGRRGFDALGVVQRRGSPDRAGGGPLEFLVLADGGRHRAPAERSSAARAACGRLLHDVSAPLLDALMPETDLLALNRFGSLEAQGGGLLAVLARAIDLDVPVVIAVPEALFASWLLLAEGLAVRIAPDLRSLESWWRSLAKTPAAGASRETFCARFK